MLRRYVAGYIVIGDYLVGEARGLLGGDAELKPLLRSQAALFEHLLDTVGEEYTREVHSRPTTAEQRLAARLERLVNGEPLDISDFGYSLDGWHLGMVASGHGAPEEIRRLCATLDSRLLLACRVDGTVWAWLGRRRPFNAREIQIHFSKSWSSKDLSLAIGAPEEGLTGWRLSHRQARAALPVALCGSEPVVRYAKVPLLAAALRDEVLAASLHRIFLAPLAGERDGGATLRATLRGYFAAARNTSSAAVVLRVSRQTVNNHLRAVEERIGCSLDDCLAELQTALQLEDLDANRAVSHPHSRVSTAFRGSLL